MSGRALIEHNVWTAKSKVADLCDGNISVSEIGGVDVVADQIMLAAYDRNDGGRITDSICREYKKESQQSLDRMLNFTMAALVSSIVLLSCIYNTDATTNLVISQETKNYFDSECETIQYAYTIVSQLIIGIGILEFLLAMTVYTALTSWHQDRESQVSVHI